MRNGAHLAHLFTVFPRGDVHVVVHDDFRADNAAVYRQMLEFLAVDPSFAPQFRIVNPTSQPRSQALQRTLWRDGGAVRALARALVPERMRKAAFDKAARLNRRRSPHSQIDPNLAAKLWRKLEPDVQLLSNLLDRDLVALWRR